MPARRFLPAILGAGLLAACSTTDTLIDAPPSPTTHQPTAPALDLGDFDPAGEFQVFDPCTEIPAVVLEAAGLGEAVGEPGYDSGLSASCSFMPQDESVRGYFSLTGDKVPKDRIKERGLLLSDSTGSAFSETYLHHMGADFPDECSAAIHTNRGRFVVQYTEISTEQDRNALCEIATDKFDTILNLMGENNGDLYRP